MSVTARLGEEQLAIASDPATVCNNSLGEKNLATAGCCRTKCMTARHDDDTARYNECSRTGLCFVTFLKFFETHLRSSIISVVDTNTHNIRLDWSGIW
jgi:hypothetical protein